MDINVTEFKIAKNNEEHIRLMIKDERKNRDYLAFYIVSREEWETIGKPSCMGIGNNPYINDGNNLLSFRKNGLVCAYLDSREADRFEFPAWELIQHMDKAFSMLEVGEMIDLASSIEEWKAKYSPFVEISYAGKEVRETLMYDLKHPMLISQKKIFFIERLLTNASFHSDGNKVIVLISFDNHRKKEDGTPNDYYWVIAHDDGRRIENGGLIAHYVGDGKWEYAMHT